MLTAPMIIVTAKPTTGPLRPKSNSWSLLAGGPFREMRAPKVPMGGGPGMKYGKVASSLDRKSTRLNSSHRCISYAVFCLKKKKKQYTQQRAMSDEAAHL